MSGEELRGEGVRRDGVRLRRLPEAGARVPGYAVRVAFAAAAIGLCLDRLQPGFWLTVTILLAGLAAILPRTLAAWALILILGVSQLYRPAGTLDAHFLLLLAGLHLLHVLAAWTIAAPARGWVQLAVFARPLSRWLAIQVPVQAIAVLVLLRLQPGGAHLSLPAAGIIGAVALIALVLLLVAPLLRERSR